MELITLYAKKISPPACDLMGPKTKEARDWHNKQFDVALYTDRECTNLKVHYCYHKDSRPDRRNKYVTINCYKWALEWIN